MVLWQKILMILLGIGNLLLVVFIIFSRRRRVTHSRDDRSISLDNSRFTREITTIREHNRSILDHLNSGVITMGSDRRIDTINPRAREILGLGEHELEGEPIKKLGVELAGIMIDRQTSSSEVFSREIHLEVADRGRVPLSVTCTAMGGGEGPPSVLMVIDDRSVEKKLEEKVRRSDRLASVGSLAAGMAHEMKNPLVSIKTFTQLLPSKLDDKDFREKFSSITTQEVDRIDRMLEQLLNFSQPMSPRLEPIDLHHVIDEVLAVLEGQFEKKSAQTVCNYTDGSAMIIADRDQMKQVFMNLFLNSIDAIQNNGRIEIKTECIDEGIDGSPYLEDTALSNVGSLEENPGDRPRGGCLKITITDNGKGIPEDMLPSLYDLYFTTRSEGFGLGLAIVRDILHGHNATIEIESKESSWTRVTMNFPLSTTPKPSHKRFSGKR